MKQILLAAAFSLIAATANAQPVTQVVTWQVINEYPATSLPGEADAFFARTVKEKTGGRVVIEPIPDAKSGLRTREQLKAVSEGRYAMANSFAGALSEESPVFLLSSLPFLTSTATQARTLYEAAAPLYEKLFAEHGQKLLYVSPWPPSGIWSADPVSGRRARRAKNPHLRQDRHGRVFAGLFASPGRVFRGPHSKARNRRDQRGAVLGRRRRGAAVCGNI